MFDKLRSAFSSAAKSLGEKELKEKDIEDVLFELEISLLESDVASEVVDTIKSDLKSRLVGSKVDKNSIEKFVKDNLISSISSLIDTAGSVNLVELINAKKNMGEPFLILFVGINGTGKTTSLAKIAYMLREAKFSVVVAAADTFRAGAIEQLRGHTNRLNLKLVAQNYNSDPAAVARDAVLYAKSHRTNCVLIDTAGRMQTSKNLMEQITKITKVVNPDFKIFVGDSLAGNDTVNQAREFFEHTRFNGSILTKSDADARGGAALSIAKITSTPVLYLGVGQEYKDLKPFNKEAFLETIFGSLDDVDMHEIPHKVSTETMPEVTSDTAPDILPEQEPAAPKPHLKTPQTQEALQESKTLQEPTQKPATPPEQKTTEYTADTTEYTKPAHHQSKKPQSTPQILQRYHKNPPHQRYHPKHHQSKPQSQNKIHHRLIHLPVLMTKTFSTIQTCLIYRHQKTTMRQLKLETVYVNG